MPVCCDSIFLIDHSTARYKSLDRIAVKKLELTQFLTQKSVHKLHWYMKRVDEVVFRHYGSTHRNIQVAVHRATSGYLMERVQQNSISAVTNSDPQKMDRNACDHEPSSCNG